MKEWINFDNQRLPSTRYQGSKRKLLPWIYKTFHRLDFRSVLDAFGGSGSVSYLLKLMGKEVTYNDYLKFNSIIGKSIIQNNSVTLEEKDIKYLLNNDFSNCTFIQNNFEGFYYLDSENIWLDNIISRINKLKNISDQSDYKESIALNALFQSCLIKRPYNLFHRKNLNLRTNNVPRSFGNKSTLRPLRKDFAVFAVKIFRLSRQPPCLMMLFAFL